jgi:hypothetical protein
MLFAGQQTTPYYRWLHLHTHARFRLARALRTGEQAPWRRALGVVRHGIVRVLSSAALTLAARARVQVRAFPPELSRELAATPERGGGSWEQPR